MASRFRSMLDSNSTSTLNLGSESDPKLASDPRLTSDPGLASEPRLASDSKLASDSDQRLAPNQSQVIVLASETIYSPLALQHFSYMTDAVLSIWPHASMYVACKQIYFGVGGSLFEYKHMLETSYKLKCSSVWESELAKDQSVARSIVQIVK